MTWAIIAWLALLAAGVAYRGWVTRPKTSRVTWYPVKARHIPTGWHLVVLDGRVGFAEWQSFTGEWVDVKGNFVRPTHVAALPVKGWA